MISPAALFRVCTLSVFALLLACVSCAARPKIDSYRHSETRIEAEVVHIGGESVITVMRGGEVICRTSLVSEDGNHGWDIQDVAISPAGEFVAFQARTSGGHQPWREPVFVIDVDGGSMMDVGALIESQRGWRNVYTTSGWAQGPGLIWLGPNRLGVKVARPAGMCTTVERIPVTIPDTLPWPAAKPAIPP